MKDATTRFSLSVEATPALCPAGEAYAKRNREERRIPVLSCEGPCIRGEIARLAANDIAKRLPTHARACHAETFFVPNSAMAQWVRRADECVVIDGCFLKCHGRVLEGLVAKERIIHFDALSIHHKYSDAFLMDDVPEPEREETARRVADRVVAMLASREQEERPCQD